MRYPMQPILLCAYEVDADPVFDALDAADLSAEAVTEAGLRCPGWQQDAVDGRISDSQSLAERLIAAGYVGMRVPSFAPGAASGDSNLVLWHWSDRLPSRVVPIDDERRLTPA